MGIIETGFTKPWDGPHRDAAIPRDAVGKPILQSLDELCPLEGGVLRAKRRDKFLAMGRELAGH